MFVLDGIISGFVLYLVLPFSVFNVMSVDVRICKWLVQRSVNLCLHLEAQLQCFFIYVSKQGTAGCRCPSGCPQSHAGRRGRKAPHPPDIEFQLQWLQHRLAYSCCGQSSDDESAHCCGDVTPLWHSVGHEVVRSSAFSHKALLFRRFRKNANSDC